MLTAITNVFVFIFTSIKEYIQQGTVLLAGGQDSTNQSTNKTSKAVKRIQTLEHKLKLIVDGYDKTIADLQQQYNKDLIQYDKQYRTYSSVFSKFNVGLATEDELKKAEHDYLPLKEVMEASNNELEKAKTYKKEEVLSIVDEIDTLKNKYTTDLANDIIHKADKLQETRTDYLQQIVAVGQSYQSIIELENMINKELSKLDIEYKKHVLDMFSIKTEGIRLDNLLVDTDTVTLALKGKIEY